VTFCCGLQLGLCLTVLTGQGCNSEVLVLVAESPESRQHWLKLLQDMSGTVVSDIGKEYAAVATWLVALLSC